MIQIRVSRLAGVLTLAIGMALVGSIIALADNSGDVFVDLPGHAGDPGHENDPHICGPVDIYANGMATSTGTYTVTSWPPTGNSSVVASGAWNYNRAAGGNQMIAGPLFLATGHYKLTVNQSPVKEKVFWETCQVQPPPPPSPAFPF